jgi:hypothetical protein
MEGFYRWRDALVYVEAYDDCILVYLMERNEIFSAKVSRLVDAVRLIDVLNKKEVPFIVHSVDGGMLLYMDEDSYIHMTRDSDSRIKTIMSIESDSLERGHEREFRDQLASLLLIIGMFVIWVLVGR